MIPCLWPVRGGSWGKPRASGDDPVHGEIGRVGGGVVSPGAGGGVGGAGVGGGGGGGVNPARAGMIPGAGNAEEGGDGKPRASGDDPNPYFSS